MEEVKITSGFAQILDGKCLKCGKGVPYYCEECHQKVLAVNARLQYHLEKVLPKEKNQIRLHNIINHFDKIKHAQQTVEINAEDIKAIQELIATNQHLKHKFETYYQLYWDETILRKTVEEKIDELKQNKESYTFHELTSEDIRRTVITNLEDLLKGKEEDENEE